MTPKEKALQLCQKFGYLGIKWEQTEYTTLSLENAKECASIAVDETIRTLNEDIRDIDVRGNILLDLIDYWREVKKEIEKL
jgi:hypothetical protein